MTAIHRLWDRGRVHLVVDRILRREPISFEGGTRGPGRPHPTEVILAEPRKFLFGFLDTALDVGDLSRVDDRKPLAVFNRVTEVLLIRLDRVPKSPVGTLSSVRWSSINADPGTGCDVTSQFYAGGL